MPLRQPQVALEVEWRQRQINLRAPVNKRGATLEVGGDLYCLSKL